MAATRGLGRLPAETPPPLYAYDPDIGRLAITTPHYNTAILAVNRGAVPYGGMEPARLFDGDQRVAASIGGRPYASFGVVVTDHASGHRTETQRGRLRPDFDDPPLRLTRAPRGTRPTRRYPRHAYAGPFQTLDAEGWTTGPTVRVRSRHRFKAAHIESTWSLLPRARSGRHSAHLLFPSWGGRATVTVVGRDGSRRELRKGRVDLARVAWFELMGPAGGYVVVPRAPRRAHACTSCIRLRRAPRPILDRRSPSSCSTRRAPAPDRRDDALRAGARRRGCEARGRKAQERAMRLPLAGIACLVAAMAAAPAAVAAPPISPPALRIDGAGPGAHTGASVAGAGDVNGDGHADIVIGSPLGLTGAAGCTGTAQVLFGPFAPGTLDLRTTPCPG